MPNTVLEAEEIANKQTNKECMDSGGKSAKPNLQPIGMERKSKAGGRGSGREG